MNSSPGAKVLGAAIGILLAAGTVHADALYSSWPTDALDNPNFFPIGVWYQSPNPSVNNEISGYAAIGINTFVYLNPANTTPAILNDIAAEHMYAIMPYSASLVNNPTIIAWYSSPDEPDNAQDGTEYPVLPATQIAEYQTIQSENSSLPVYEGFGQGVANPYWVGRGVRTGDNQDYPYQTSFVWTDGQTYTQGYLASTDIGAFDFYPENATGAAAGQTSLLAQGVRNMVAWSKPGAPVWAEIETTQITQGVGSAPTPAQVKAEVWLALVNGANGITYFAHTISPFSEDALLSNPTMSSAVAAINTRLEALAPALNSPTVDHGITLATQSGTQDVEFMTKVLNNVEYIFAATDQNSGNGAVTFDDPTLAGLNATVQVLDENRTLQMIGGEFTDSFTSNDVHLYSISLPVPEPASLALLTAGGFALLRRRRGCHLVPPR